MVVGAVILGDCKIEGLGDSKKLSAKKREKLAYEIKEQAVAVATGWVSSVEIDELGLMDALKLATRRAVTQIDCEYNKVVIDGTVKLIDDVRVVTLPKADALVPAVSAASIVAKVARDLYMSKLGKKYPEYGFEKHVGYGTAMHREALEKHGPTPEHRKSFAPVSKLLDYKLQNVRVGPLHKNTTRVGGEAEGLAAEYLVGRGHEIVARNWKCKICEIDIISVRDGEIYFTEVKYRRNSRSGGGIEAIDERKEKQIRLAAEVYLALNDLVDKAPVHLSAVSVMGEPPVVETYIEDI